MKVVFFSLAISATAAAGSVPADGHQMHNAISMAGGRILAPRGNGVARGAYYTGYRPGEVRAYRGPMEIAPQWRQNQNDVARDPGNNVAKVRAQESESQLKGANSSVTSQSLSSAQSSAQGTAHRPIGLPAGVKPQVTTPAERSQATENINQKFQQAENKITNRPGDRPDRRNRLEQSRTFFIGLIDWGYPLSLLDTWCDDLLDDQIDAGMPVDLIDSYWGQPISTQDYEEYYNPYQVCTYLAPDGSYRQVTFQNGVVTQ
ncbi:MAG TPA: hypothetical protein VE641_21310 [Chthoniobacterales bacterium]|nr:hypothetical protein [Chthoniobacterales bacterium]